MNHVKEVITPKEAGRLLGRSQKTVEHGLRTGAFPFGTAYRLPSGRYVYIIPKEAFERFMKGGAPHEPENCKTHPSAGTEG